MKKLVLLFGLLSLVPCAARAQRVELFGGYSYLRLDTGAGTVHLDGWDASGTIKTNSWIGLTGDFSGAYGSPFGPSTSLHTYLFGPQLSLPSPIFSPFFHALVGGATTKTGNSSDTAFATALGGGLDTKIAPLLSFRIVQVDYLATRFGGNTQNNLRVSTGIVIRF
jgi:hypothetical protein